MFDSKQIRELATGDFPKIPHKNPNIVLRVLYKMITITAFTVTEIRFSIMMQ